MEWSALIALLIGLTTVNRIQTVQHSRRLATSVIELYLSFLRQCYSEAKFRDEYLAELSRLNFEQSTIMTASLTSILDKRDILRGYSATSRVQWEAMTELVKLRPKFCLNHHKVVISAYQLVRQKLPNLLTADPSLRFVPWRPAIRGQVEGETLQETQQNSLLRELEFLFFYNDAICESQKVFNTVGMLEPGRSPIPHGLSGI